MIGAALLAKSFVRLLEVKPGFDPSQTLTMEVSLVTLPPSKYAKDDEQVAFYGQILDRLNHSPGVVAAGAVLSLPLTGAQETTDLFIEGRATPPADQRPEADYTIVTPEYFRALAIPLVKGRQFSDSDRKGSTRVIIINDALARRYWPTEKALGQRIRVGFEDSAREIIGVVGDIKKTALRATPS